jgi:hypothetical protein
MSGLQFKRRAFDRRDLAHYYRVQRSQCDKTRLAWSRDVPLGPSCAGSKYSVSQVVLFLNSVTYSGTPKARRARGLSPSDLAKQRPFGRV